MSGTLYGIGLGPGDPELVTLKAMRLMRAAAVVAYPVPDGGTSLARQIAAPYLSETQTELEIPVPMRTERGPAQAAYDEAVAQVFETLEWLEDRLTTRRYLCGDTLTEADIRLLPTLIRFDLVYHTHFKCNRKWLREYPAVWAYTRDLCQMPGVGATIDPRHIVRHYHYSHETINPFRIVPINPVVDFAAPQDRANLSGHG